MTDKEIHNICKEYDITNYTINKDKSIDVNDNVYLSYMNLYKIPIRFNKVNGYFECTNNKLTSLENSPNIVNGGCSFQENCITTLIDGPKIVNGSFDVSNNKLTSLEGSPDIVDGIYYCSSNIIKDLNGITTKIRYSIRLYNNPLQSLNGCIISYRKIQIEESLKLKLIRKDKLKLIEQL